MISVKNAFSLSLIALAITGCKPSDSDLKLIADKVSENIEGASGSSGESPTGYTGTAIDGYLVNAEVYVDRNGDGVTSESEYIGLTDENGNYSVSGEDAAFPVIVKVVAGKTSDTDYLGFVSKGYELTAEAGALVVSPFTTLAKLNNIDVESYVASIGLDPTHASGNYLEENSNSAKELHVAARLLTSGVFSETLSETLISGDVESKFGKYKSRVDNLVNLGSTYDQILAGDYTTIKGNTLDEDQLPVLDKMFVKLDSSFLKDRTSYWFRTFDSERDSAYFRYDASSSLLNVELYTPSGYTESVGDYYLNYSSDGSELGLIDYQYLGGLESIHPIYSVGEGGFIGYDDYGIVAIVDANEGSNAYNLNMSELYNKPIYLVLSDPNSLEPNSPKIITLTISSSNIFEFRGLEGDGSIDSYKSDSINWSGLARTFWLYKEEDGPSTPSKIVGFDNIYKDMSGDYNSVGSIAMDVEIKTYDGGGRSKTGKDYHAAYITTNKSKAEGFLVKWKSLIQENANTYLIDRPNTPE